MTSRSLQGRRTRRFESSKQRYGRTVQGISLDSRLNNNVLLPPDHLPRSSRRPPAGENWRYKVKEFQNVCFITIITSDDVGCTNPTCQRRGPPTCPAACRPTKENGLSWSYNEEWETVQQLKATIANIEKSAHERSWAH